MKHPFNFVAVVLAVLLAVPASLAEGLCLSSQSSIASMECCNVARVGTLIVSSTVNHDCNEGCCSVAPQKSPAPIVTDKLKADSPAPDSIFAIPILKLHTSRNLSSSVLGAICSTQDLPVLLRTFRI